MQNYILNDTQKENTQIWFMIVKLTDFQYTVFEHTVIEAPGNGLIELPITAKYGGVCF